MALGVRGEHLGSVSVASKEGAEQEKEADAAKAHRKPLSAQLLPPKASATALFGLSLLGSFGPPFPASNFQRNFRLHRHRTSD